MATKKKAADISIVEEVPETEVIAEEPEEEETEPAEKDLEIAALKAELAKLKAEAVSEVFVPNGRGDMERIQRVAKDAAENGVNAWNIRVKVRVPRKAGAGDDDFWICVNGVSAQIPANGQVQEMKLPFAMALMDSLEAEEKAIEFAEGLKMYDPVTNPKPMG